MIRKQHEWFEILEREEKALGFDQGFKIVCGPMATLKTAEVAFLSLNPGRAPDNADLRTVSDERGNSYRVERATTRSPLTAQFLAMADFLGLYPDLILAGMAAPFRSRGWDSLSERQRAGALAVGRRFWAAPLRRTDLRLVICCSSEATAMACELTGAQFEATVPAGWGTIMLRRYRTREGRRIVQLPHLSRFRLFGRRQSEQALRTLFTVA